MQPPPSDTRDLSGLRVLLVHGWIYTWAGAERVLEQLTQLLPQADILAGIVAPKMRATNVIAARARESWVGLLPGSRTHHRWFLPLHAAAFRTWDTSGYDLVISVSHAFEKAIRVRKPTVHLSYCLSPPRYLWDLSDAHDRMATGPQRIALSLARAPLKALDRTLAQRVDRFVSLSRYVADRVKRNYGRDSTVVYPPVALKPVHEHGPREDFLLTIGRLVPYKRVDLAIRAAEKLGRRLVVAGEGPELPGLRAIAGPNVEFVGPVAEDRAGDLLSRCAAFVFCAEEDFGIAPLEANAHGSPVVYYGRGATLETMRDGVTGVAFQEQTVDSAAEAIGRCLASAWDGDALRANAARFSPGHFREGMRAEIQAVLQR